MRFAPLLANLPLVFPAFAQTPLLELAGDAQDHFGAALARAGDVDHDGVGDLVIGSPHTGSAQGSVWVYSGRTGAALIGYDSPWPTYCVGTAVAGGMDVDGDGTPDFASASPFESVNAPSGGAARVFSGADGDPLHVFGGTQNSEGLSGVAFLSDLDGDDCAEVAIASPRRDAGQKLDAGRVRVMSGRTGAALWSVVGSSAGGWFGGALRNVGDVNDDGFDDLGASSKIGAGSVLTLSGLDGSVIWHAQGVPAWTLEPAGDVNGDGRDDVLAGHAESSVGGAQAGAVTILSGLDGSKLWEVFGTPDARIGWSVANVGDLSQDGVSDVAITEYTASLIAQTVRMVSGADGSTLQWITSPAAVFESFGGPLAAGHDLDGDGDRELLVAGVINQSSSGARVYLLPTGTPPGTSYCGPSVPNSTGLSARLLSWGSALASDVDLRLTAVDLPPGKPARFLASPIAAFLPAAGDGDGNLCVGFPFARLEPAGLADAGGRTWIDVPLNALPYQPVHIVAAGETWHFQCWFRDSHPPHTSSTSNFTDGHSVTFQ